MTEPPLQRRYPLCMTYLKTICGMSVVTTTAMLLSTVTFRLSS